MPVTTLSGTSTFYVQGDSAKGDIFRVNFYEKALLVVSL